jgi:hypothetical protein
MGSVIIRSNAELVSTDLVCPIHDTEPAPGEVNHYGAEQISIYKYIRVPQQILCHTILLYTGLSTASSIQAVLLCSSSSVKACLYTCRALRSRRGAEVPCAMCLEAYRATEVNL